MGAAVPAVRRRLPMDAAVVASASGMSRPGLMNALSNAKAVAPGLVAESEQKEQRKPAAKVAKPASESPLSKPTKFPLRVSNCGGS